MSDVGAVPLQHMTPSQDLWMTLDAAGPQQTKAGIQSPALPSVGHECLAPVSSISVWLGLDPLGFCLSAGMT